MTVSSHPDTMLVTMMRQRAQSTRALEMAMRLSYAELLANHSNNAAQWQEVHRTVPESAVAALTLAVVQANVKDVALTLLSLTQSPSYLFVMLADGVGFDEDARTAVFASAESAAVFARQFPEWVSEIG